MEDGSRKRLAMYLEYRVFDTRNQQIFEPISGMLEDPAKFPKKTRLLFFASMGDRATALDTETDLPIENRITLKKSFPKSIKRSSHNR